MVEPVWIVVFLNMVVNLLLLLATNKLCGYPDGFTWLSLSAILGGIYAGSCWLPRFQFLGNMCWRLVSLALMGWLAYGISRGSLRRTFVFSVLRMALDSIAYGLGSDNFWLMIIAAGVVFAVCTFGFQDKLVGMTYVPVELRYGEKYLQLTALRDTGNTLVDPITGKSVLVVDAQTASSLTGLTQQQLNRPVEAFADAHLPGLRLIPYQTVGNSDGLLLALRIPQVRIGDWEGSTLVAFAPNGFSREGTYQALTGGTV